MLQLLHAQSPPTIGGIITAASASAYLVLVDGESQIHILSACGESLDVIKCHNPRTVWALATATDGPSEGGEEIVLVGDTDGRIYAYSIPSGDPRLPFPRAHEWSITAFAIVNVLAGSSSSTTCPRLLSSDAAGLITVWDLENRTVVHVLQGHYKPGEPYRAVPFLFMLPGENTLASGSSDGTIRLWDMETGVEKAVLDVKAHTSAGLERTLGDGSASRDDHDLAPEESKHTRTDDSRETIYGFLIVEDGRIIAGGKNGFVRVWDTASRSLIANWQAHFKGNPRSGPVLNNILLHPSRAAFITTGTDGCICLWDLKTYGLLRSIEPFDKSVTSVTFLDNTVICSGKDTGGVESACGLYCRVIKWDLSQLRIDDGKTEGFTDLGMPSGFIRKVWNSGRNVALTKARGDETRVEIWGEKDEGL